MNGEFTVNRQTIEFEKVIQNENEVFKQLVLLYTNREWNDCIRKIAVWPKSKGRTRRKEFLDFEEVNYSEKDNDFIFEWRTNKTIASISKDYVVYRFRSAFKSPSFTRLA